MKIRYIICSILLLLAYSCTKNSDTIFTGVVKRQESGCSGSTGFVFIIKYVDQNNREDSFSTLTLPTQYKLPGTKITFQMQDVSSADEAMYCNAMMTTPKQKIIFNVRN